MEFKHIPVMAEECMSALALKDNGIYFDGTLGGAGHSYEILSRSKGTSLIATDLDNEALLAASERLSPFAGRFKLFHDNFKNACKVFDEAGVDKIDGALLDLGVSSYQLDCRSRGFTYMAEDAKLDMRMNPEAELSAYTVINEYDEKKLKEIFYLYGEEKFSANIAKNVVLARAVKPIETAGDLVKIIERSIPARFKQDGHPARRTFQAVRIEVNGELSGLKEAVDDIASRLKKGARFAVITFHSLEDRIIKHAFKDLATGCICDKSLPICVCHRTAQAEILTSKPIEASEEEREKNPRSRSAKLRVIEKL